jgi:hypothetical protein
MTTRLMNFHRTTHRMPKRLRSQAAVKWRDVCAGAKSDAPMMRPTRPYLDGTDLHSEGANDRAAFDGGESPGMVLPATGISLVAAASHATYPSIYFFLRAMRLT